MSVIKPTVGRIVHFFPVAGVKPLAAIICHVQSTGEVNLTVFGASGSTTSMTNVPLVQPDSDVPGDGRYCAWMPYQVKKEFGSESGEKSVGTEQV